MKIVLILCLLVFINFTRLDSCQKAFAWLPDFSENDEKTVKQAELIVVGHLKLNPIHWVSSGKPNQTILEISEILKGSCKDKEIPIIIGWRLSLNNDASTDILKIEDANHSGYDPKSRLQFVSDVRKDNIWFLRRESSVKDNDPYKLDSNDLGIFAPVDLQPLQLKQYFLAYLSANPESSIKKFAHNGLVAEEVQRYLIEKGIH